MVGSKVAISGNLDPVAAIKNGTPENIIQLILRIYESIGNPYILNAGCEIPSGTPVENLNALCEEISYIL